MSESLGVLANNFSGSTEDIDVGSFNFDLEELDDVEYQIPHITEIPTLESILNETDDRLSINEDNDSLNWSHGLHQAVGLTVEGGSETLSLASQRSRGSSDRKGTSSTAFLRHVLLKGISTQIASASERINAGLATAITVSSMVAVGTSHGLVLVFDGRQTLRWCLTNAESQEQGSVSSLCFNSDSTRLLIGFARGHILMFDITNGKLLRTLTDVHPPGTAVLSVKFTDSSTLALCADSGGSVFELNFRRTLGVRGCDSKCLFSGSRGEVCVMEPLLLNHLPSHPLQGVTLVAMATLSKVIVVSIRPKMRVVLVHALPPGCTLLPLVAWQFVVIQVGISGKVIDPVLAYAKDNTINFFQVSVDCEMKLRVCPLQKLVVSYSLIALHWLSSWTLAVVDVTERLHLVDVHTHEELETLDLSSTGMVYESSNFKGIQTGGNVSRAMAVAGEKACYNTIVSHGNQLIVLGARAVHLMSIRPWSERLNHLVKQKKYLTALSLGLSFYEEPKAAVGLKGSRERRQDMAKGKMIQILDQLIEDMDNPAEEIPACIQYASSIRHFEIIFTRLWEAVYLDPVTKMIYLESLEPLILNDQLYSVPPAILQQFVNCYEASGKLQALEACIIHLDISSLDLHQVVQICWTHGLYDALIHIHNRALNDYTTPIHELVPIIDEAISSGRELNGKEVELGNKLLVYVSCCLAGRGYPLGDVPRDSVQNVKYEIFKCLTSVHSKNADDSEVPYPYIRTLAHFDTREFLNVVSLAFTEPEFTSELGLRQRQRLVNIVLHVMVETPGFSTTEVGALFTFLARQLGRPNSGLQVDQKLFDKVVEYLTKAEGHREERQQALLELLRSGTLQDYSRDTLLELATTAKFYRVCEVIYEQSAEWDKVLECYLEDPLRTPQVFPFLRNILVLLQHGDDSSGPVLDTVCRRIATLMSLDSGATAGLVQSHLMDKLEVILGILKDDPRYQLILLKSVLFEKPKDLVKDHEIFYVTKYLDVYITLVLKHERKAAIDVLRTYMETSSIDHLLTLAVEADHHRAQAFLLEKKQDFKAAFNVFNGELLKCLRAPDSLVSSSLDELVMETVGIIQRSKYRCSELQRMEMWTSLLDILMKSSSSLPQNDRTRLMQRVLAGTVGHANPSYILKYLLQHPAFSGGTFGEVRNLLSGMLENSQYEERLVMTAQRLVHADLHTQLAHTLQGVRRGLRPLARTCSICRQELRPGLASGVFLFPCGHPTHPECAPLPSQCPVCCTIALDEASRRQATARSSNSEASFSDLLQGHQLALKVGASPAPDLEHLEELEASMYHRPVV